MFAKATFPRGLALDATHVYWVDGGTFEVRDLVDGGVTAYLEETLEGGQTGATAQVAVTGVAPGTLTGTYSVIANAGGAFESGGGRAGDAGRCALPLPAQ